MSIVGSSDFKPRARIKDPALLRLLKLEYDCCEITGQTVNLELHHVIFKSHGGDDVRANIICLTKWFHDMITEEDIIAKRRLAEHIDSVRRDVADYIADKLGGAPALLGWYERYGFEGGVGG